MLFFTRQLYEDMQPISGAKARHAEREWSRRLRISRRYDEAIKPLLSAAAIKLLRVSFHDAVVESVSQKSGTIAIVLDARPCTTGTYRGRRVGLTFAGVRARIRTKGLVGQWWLYSEIHLASRTKFILHVLLTKSELEIPADSVLIEEIK